jgi:hypothetical protein
LGEEGEGGGIGPLHVAEFRRLSRKQNLAGQQLLPSPKLPIALRNFQRQKTLFSLQFKLLQLVPPMHNMRNYTLRLLLVECSLQHRLHSPRRLRRLLQAIRAIVILLGCRTTVCVSTTVLFPPFIVTQCARRRAAKFLRDTVFLCNLMADPVVASDVNAYDRHAIEQWMEGRHHPAVRAQVFVAEQHGPQADCGVVR